MLMQPTPTIRYDVPLIDYDDHYADRAAAGRQLAERLQRYRGSSGVVLALPPAGIAVAGERAHALRLPLDVLRARTFVVRQYPTLAAGALSEGGGLCFNAAVLRLPGVAPHALWREARRTHHELAALALSYRHGRAHGGRAPRAIDHRCRAARSGVRRQRRRALGPERSSHAVWVRACRQRSRTHDRCDALVHIAYRGCHEQHPDIGSDRVDRRSTRDSERPER